ncbi:exodeoxyribonuclease VII large subunit [Holospora curviuscula]|uniref:Exodeoxyribonuclease 7 large subunit n=1 Tax=Holospora curviuscula TaxID=1082868 RepID=A0A2S5R999_9PROT|nr:exodeoxyribonuclease VII large subunit [Holospora curviuscula]PPE03901.1 Exodeoxyribonuclease 7 large subunit [Holospora curviuscula]
MKASAVLTVTELSNQLKNTLDAYFAQVTVQGEISGYKCHVSGHHYFSLKDGQNVIDGVCWRGTALKVPLKDGMQVLCQGRVSVYGARSKYQILVSHLWEQGKGVLWEQLERLKAKLQGEGIFNQKRPLPLFPSHLGILTSPTGAVIQDMLDRCQARWPCRITLFPIQVQGNRVADDVLQGLKFFHTLPASQQPDILIIARGGGSMEDLWGFQCEALVRGVAASSIPTVSAIGHETDTTLIDYAADLRAPTPTAAMELVLPHRQELRKRLWSLSQRIQNNSEACFELCTVKYQHIMQRWGAFERYPEEPLMQTLDDIWDKLCYGVRREFEKKCTEFFRLEAKIHQKWGDNRWAETQLSAWKERLIHAFHTQFKQKRETLTWMVHRLSASSYKKTLARGFTLTQTPSGTLLTSAISINSGQEIRLIWHDGVRTGRLD